jgi:basic amino acid/polyamine antiporter, APA family
MAELQKTLGIGTIIALTLTSLVGTGVFLATSIGAKYSGNGVILAWAILLLIGLYVAGCFGELIAMFPKSGGVYEFAKKAYGRFFSFIIGWVSWLVATITISVLIIAALEFLPIPGLTGSTKLIVAVVLIIILNFVAYMGADISGAVLVFFAIETVLLFLSLIIPGFLHLNWDNFVPFMTKPFVWVFVSMFFMIESLMGWESASFLAEETKDAEKIIPKALMITTLISGAIGLFFSFISLGVIPASTLVNSQVPVLDLAARLLFSPQQIKIISYGVLLVLIGSVVGGVVSTPRLLLAMARDKLFIVQLAAIHEKRKTPYKAIIFQAIVSIIIIIIGFGNYNSLLSMLTPLALIMYAVVLLSVTILRFKLKDVKRTFKVPFGKILPVLIALLYIGVLAAWLLEVKGALNLFGIIMSLVFFGIPIYLILIFFYNPDAIVNFSNYFSHLTLWMENILLPRRMRRQIIGLFKDLEGKTVLEYGAGVGTLTMHLAEAVGPRGKIYATDLSRRNVSLLRKRLAKKGVTHVAVIHDEHQVNRVHPDINSVDFVFSVGMMSYMQDVRKILKQMNRMLPDAGRICFVEYVNFFRFLPDAEWLSDTKEVKKTFNEAGFSVKVEKRPGLFWNYLFIYGIKSEENVPVI